MEALIAVVIVCTAIILLSMTGLHTKLARIENHLEQISKNSKSN